MDGPLVSSHLIETVLQDTPDFSIVGERWIDDVTGAVTATGRRLVPKPGTPAANAQTLEQRALGALDANATYLALATPTNAQVAAQVTRLTRECSAVIRMLLGRTDDTAGT